MLRHTVIYCQYMETEPDPKRHHLPMKPGEARPFFREIVETGVVAFSSHAKEEMEKDELETTDCLNVIRGGGVHPAEFVNGEWRYRVSTQRMCIVVAIVSATRIRVVTAWRIHQ
jgi:hypothetical protein